MYILMCQLFSVNYLILPPYNFVRCHYLHLVGEETETQWS